MSEDRIRLGVSACLLGQRVRFDGGHKRDEFLVESLGRFVEWVPVCPEVESGMTAPRESMRLVQSAGRIRLVTTTTGEDMTEPMERAATRRIATLGESGLCGFILKKDSPSCGLHRVKVYDIDGPPARSGRGLFAAALAAHFPLLPVEEEGRLRDPRLREHFIERVFAYRRVTTLFAEGWSTADLVRFHAAHKLALMAHDPRATTILGRLVASAKQTPRTILRERYTAAFMTTLATLATRQKHANVLQHMLGYFKRALDRDGRSELLDALRHYAAGFVPLVVPLTLFRHHIRRLGVVYLTEQVYLQPHPMELMLRNHV